MKRLIAFIAIFLVFNICFSTVAFCEWVPPNALPDLMENPDIRTKMSFTILAKTGNDIAICNNSKQILENGHPVLHNGKPYIPLRFLAESYNSVWEWADKTQEFYVEYKADILLFKVGSQTAYKGNDDIILEDVAVLIDGELYISLPSVELAFEKSVWCDENGYLFVCDKGMELSKEEQSEVIYLYDKADKSREPLKLYVSPDGSDDNDGSENAPFKTIQKAKTTIRYIVRDGKMNSDIHVYLREGNYYIDKELKFTDKDSGQDFFDVVWQSYPGEHVSINGGKIIDNWEPYNNHIYRSYIGENQSVHTLYENGAMKTKARFPNEGKTVYDGWMHPESFPADEVTVKFPVGSIPSVKNSSDLEAVMWPGNGIMWFLNYRDVVYADWERGFLTLDRVVYSGSSGLVTDSSYYFLQGALEFLDVPGEFYYETETGYVYYYPENDIENAVISYGVAEHILNFNGKSEKNMVHNIKFADIELLNTRRTDKIYGFGDEGYLQLNFDEDELGHGVRFCNSENIEIKNCQIHDVSHAGVYFRLTNRNNRVYGNNIFNVGSDGIALYTPGLYNNLVSPEDGLDVPYLTNPNPLSNYGHYIANNNIRHATMLYYQASGISGYSVGQGDVHVANNRISDIKRIGINWGCSKDRNYIEYNDISEVMNGSEDGGAIYVHFEPHNGGAVVRNNWLHDCYAWKGGIASVYFDENGNSAIMERNISERFASADGKANFISNLQKGIDIKTINNIQVNNKQETMSVFNFSDSHKKPETIGVTLKNNIIYDNGSKTVNVTRWREGYFKESDYNCYYNKGEEVISESPSMSFTEWQAYDDAKFDQHSVLADPYFVDEANGDYRLKYNSPALALGTKSINVYDIGLKKDFKYGDSSDIPAKIQLKENGTLGQCSVINLNSGESAELAIKLRTQNGYSFDGSDMNIVFKSANSAIAEVSKKGVITAKSAGVTRITAEYLKDSYKVSSVIDVIVDDQVTDVDFQETRRVFPCNSSQELTPYIKTMYGQVGVTSLDELIFSSSNEEVVRINGKGVLYAKNSGNAQITVKAVLGGRTYTETFNISVPKEYIKEAIFDIKTLYPDGKIVEIPFKLLSEVGEQVMPAGAEIESTVSNVEVLDVIGTSNGKLTLKTKEPGSATVQLKVKLHGVDMLSSVRVVVGGTSKLPANFKISNYGNAQGFAIVDGEKVFLSSNGRDVYSRNDDASFVYTEVDGENYTVYGRIENVSNVGSGNTAHGLMIRAYDGADSPMVHLRSQGGRLIMVYRNAENPGCNHIEIGRSHPIDIKLVKEGDRISGYYLVGDAHSAAADRWSLLGSVNIETKGKTLVGVAGYSQVTDVYAESNTSGFKIEAN